jgi:Domain of unknown function (DUF222)
VTAALDTAPPAPLLSEPARLLVRAVEALRAQDPTDMGGGQALAETALLLREMEKLSAVSLRRLADVDRRELHTLDAAPSVGTWVERQQVGVDRSRVALARRLCRLPALADAVEGGRLSVACAVRVGEAVEALRPHLDRADGLLDGQPAEEVLTAVLVDGVAMLVAQARGGLDDDVMAALWADLGAIAGAARPAVHRVEAGFVVLAEQVEPHLLRPALRQLVDAVLPQQLEERSQRAYTERGLLLTRDPDGAGWRVGRGRLDDECGELLWTVLQAEMATDPDNPVDTAAYAGAAAAAAAPWADAWTGPSPRSRQQRQHDALRLALRRLLDSSALGQRDKAAPHLMVTVGLDAMHGAPGALPAVTGSGATAAMSVVRRWLPDSHLTRVVLGLGRRVIETSHTERTLKSHERRALSVQWGGQCAVAGCIRGLGSPLVPHHVIPWHRCRSTSYRDTVPLCDSSHHDLHTGGKVLRLKDGRWLGPDGWIDPP